MRALIQAAYSSQVEPALNARGFVGAAGHHVRRVGEVTQIVELQHSVYGGRVTANLGLDLSFLLPVVRWIPRPTLGPHAHDATRWIRVGLTGAERADRWWPFSDASGSADEAAAALGERLLRDGLGWLERECSPEAFLRHARDKRERSRGPKQRHGGFLELRLLAAVQAWSGDRSEATRTMDAASALWREERARMIAARDAYAEKHAQTNLAPVPDLLAELAALIEPTTGVVAAEPTPRAVAPTRSRSSRR